jgi:flagellar FliL protein
MAKEKRAMANVEQALPRKGPSLVVQIAILLVMTAAAIGMGWLAGARLKGGDAPPAVPAAAENQGEPVPQPENGAVSQEASLPLVALAPITTNLASPANVWIRLEASVLYDSPQPPDMAEHIQQDLLALVRTLKLHQIEGASGYQHLKEDLEERAALRSGGHAKEILIRTLLFE